MKYKTSDLSKVLNVSSNTIRRFEDKGYLHPIRDEENGYRFFDNSDVAKTVFISKYRKFGFSHDEIAGIFQSDINENMRLCQNMMEDMDRKIAELTAIRHMLKDDINLMKRVEDLYGNGIIEKDCNAFYYVSYQKNGYLQASGVRGVKIHQFMYSCPEVKYVYLFRKENVLRGQVAYEEAIAIKQIHAERFGINVEGGTVEAYDEHPSIMGVVRLPIDFLDESCISRDEARQILYGEFFDYMKENGYMLIGDVIGIKIGFSKENDREMQYILISMPVDKI